MEYTCEREIEEPSNIIAFVAFTQDRRGAWCGPDSRCFLHPFTCAAAAFVVIAASPPVTACLKVKKWFYQNDTFCELLFCSLAKIVQITDIIPPTLQNVPFLDLQWSKIAIWSRSFKLLCILKSKCSPYSIWLLHKFLNITMIRVGLRTNSLRKFINKRLSQFLAMRLSSRKHTLRIL